MRRVSQFAREFSAKALIRTLSAVFAALLGAVLLTFQNCTQPAEMGNADANTVLSEKMAFSYDATVDQIAYMSCPNVVTQQKQNVDSDLYFTFRVGAYRFGGVKLTDSFYQTYKKKLPERMASLLSNSPANTSTLVQLAVRQVGNLNSLVVSPGNSTQNIDFANLLAVLGSSEMSTNIVQTGLDSSQNPPILTEKRIKFLRDGTGRGAHFQGDLNFGTDESTQSSVRSQYLGSGAAMLTLTYLEPTAAAGNPSGGTPVADTDVRSPATIGMGSTPGATPPPPAPGLAFGTGFQLIFAQPVPNAKGLQQGTPPTESRPYPSNVLFSVVEKDLLTGGEKGVQWNCPASLKYMIVRPGDENDVTASSPNQGPCMHTPDPPEPWDPEFAILRNALHSEDWYIDREHKCVIPKRSLGYSCYGDMTKVRYVQYELDNAAGCDPLSKDENSNSLTNKVCAAWVSVCYRMSP